MAKLPTVTSNIPRDLRNFLDRVREAFNTQGDEKLVTQGQLKAIGLLNANNELDFPATGGEYGTPPAPLNLSVSGALATILLEWDVPVYTGHAYTEVWAAQAPVGGGNPAIGNAVLIGQAPGAVYAHAIGSGATRWYWIRFVNRDGVAGAYNAVEGTQGSTAQDPSYLLDLLTGEITESQLYQTLGERIDLIDADASVVGSVAYRVAQEAAARSVAVTALDARVTTAEGSITATASSVTTLQSAVAGNTSALQTEATTRATETGNLFAQYTVKVDVNGYVAGYGLASTANNGIPTSEFIVRADTFAIASPSGPSIAPYEPFIVRTTATTINGEAVPAGVYIRDAAIQNGTITSAKIGDLAVDSTKIANAAIVTAKIADAQITAAKIVDAQITNAKIADAAITTAKIADAQVTNAKIGTAAIQTANIFDAAVTNAKIANATITAAKIADAEITNAKIADAAITNAKIATAAITAAKIADAQITTAKIENAAITTAKIADAQITGAKIGNLQVDTLKIANQAVSNTGAASGGPGSGSPNVWVVLAQVSITTSGGNVLIVQGNASTFSGGGGSEGTPGVGSVRIRVGTTTLQLVSGLESVASVGLLGTGTSVAGTTTAYIEAATGGGDGSWSATGRIVITELKK